MNRRQAEYFVIRERRQVRIRWLRGVAFYAILATVLMIVSAGFLWRFERPLKGQESDFLNLVALMLTGITAFVFAIPLLTGIETYSSNRRRPILLYLVWLLLSLTFFILLKADVIRMTPITFKIALLASVWSLGILPLYLVRFVRSSIVQELERIFARSAQLVVIRRAGIDGRNSTELSASINALRQLSILAAKACDFDTFKQGLDRICRLGKLIAGSNGTNASAVNDLFREVVRSLRHVGTECGATGGEENLREVVKSMGNLIRYAMGEGSMTGKGGEINYATALDELRKTGAVGIKWGWPAASIEVVDCLGRIGEHSLTVGAEQRLRYKPDLDVIARIREIGLMGADQGLEDLTVETLNRIESMADIAWQTRSEPAMTEAVKSHLVVSARLLWQVKDTEEWLRKAHSRMQHEFGTRYARGLWRAMEEAQVSSFFDRRVFHHLVNRLTLIRTAYGFPGRTPTSSLRIT
ncbi:MAG: hypothetical protein NTX17_02010 [Candidatus Eisenbacteria bacterium]|nr:hypothetical protein [Candidatus Eisenbacteria bacterium]